MVAFLGGWRGFALILRTGRLFGGNGAIICGGGGKMCGTWWGIAKSVTLPSLLVSPPAPGIIARLSPVFRSRSGWRKHVIPTQIARRPNKIAPLVTKAISKTVDTKTFNCREALYIALTRLGFNCKVTLRSYFTFEINLTTLTAVPREALAHFLTERIRDAVAFVVAASASQRSLRAHPSGIRRILRQIGPAFSTRTLIGAAQVEASRVGWAIVMRAAFFGSAFVEIDRLDLN